jgi:AraC-like DNA-binding protein
MAARISMLADEPRPPAPDPERGAPLLNSADTAWSGLPFEVHRVRNTGEVGVSPLLDGDHGMLVVLDGEMEFSLTLDGREITFKSRKGSVSFFSGEHGFHLTQMQGSARAAAVRLPTEWFERALLAGPPEGFGRTAPLERDDTIQTIVETMCREVAAGAPTGRLFAESLSLALVTYVAERVPPSKLRVRGGLSDEQCRRIRSYIRDRLQQELSLVELSSLVGLRPRQFSTLFRRAFGTTAHRYIVTQRVSEAARMLRSGEDNLAGIALRIGFCSQSHFTAAFRNAFGVTPGRYAAEWRKTSQPS